MIHLPGGPYPYPAPATMAFFIGMHRDARKSVSQFPSCLASPPALRRPVFC
jgi:hypothetical protein